jgi:hypothetical protein
MEPPDFDFCRAVIKGLGAFAVLVLMSVFCVVRRRFSPTGILLLSHMEAGRAGRRAEQVPARYFRVRERTTRSEVIVRMKGLYTLGDVGPDDLMSFWGRWRGGTLVARRGFNHRTRAWVEIHRSRFWMWLLLGLVAVAALGLILPGVGLLLGGPSASWNSCGPPVKR